MLLATASNNTCKNSGLATGDCYALMEARMIKCMCSGICHVFTLVFSSYLQQGESSDELIGISDFS